MPTFLLIRHGETDYNKKMRIAGRLPGVHLTKKGQRQALALAERLTPLPIKAIYASPLDRTMETAGPLARALKLEIIPTPGLLETDCGEWQEGSIRKLRRLKVWRSLQQYPSLFQFPGGETILECQHRIVQVLESLRRMHAPQDIVACFSHSDPIKQLLTHYLGMPLDNFQRLTISPASITVMNISDNGSRLIMLNYSLDFSAESLRPAQLKRKPPTSSSIPPS